MTEGRIHDPVIGVITSRRCPACGHHEVGYQTADGAFVPLRPGEVIGVFQGAPATFTPGMPSFQPESSADDTEESLVDWVVWAPEPLRANRHLCRKYGVLVDRALMIEDMSPSTYERAYRQKLQRLIAKEVDVPLSVILDRFFVAPHLAFSDPKQTAHALCKELDEISAPVARMTEWLVEGGEASLLKMIHPKTMDDLEGDFLSEEQIREELDCLSLEDFFESL